MEMVTEAMVNKPSNSAGHVVHLAVSVGVLGVAIALAIVTSTMLEREHSQAVQAKSDGYTLLERLADEGSQQIAVFRVDKTGTIVNASDNASRLHPIKIGDNLAVLMRDKDRQKHEDPFLKRMKQGSMVSDGTECDVRYFDGFHRAKVYFQTYQDGAVGGIIREDQLDE